MKHPVTDRPSHVSPKLLQKREPVSGIFSQSAFNDLYLALYAVMAGWPVKLDETLLIAMSPQITFDEIWSKLCDRII